MNKYKYYIKDSFGYRHFWMIKLSDWLYNKYMRINKEVLEKNKPRILVPDYKRLEKWHLEKLAQQSSEELKGSTTGEK